MAEGEVGLKVGRGETGHVYVDVDGTLIKWPGDRPGNPTREQRDEFKRRYASGSVGPPAHDIMPIRNGDLIRELRTWFMAGGGVLVIWSRNGADHALAAAAYCGLTDCNPVCLGKPDVAIDDKPNLWGTNPLNVVAPDAFKFK